MPEQSQEEKEFLKKFKERQQASDQTDRGFVGSTPKVTDEEFLQKFESRSATVGDVPDITDEKFLKRFAARAAGAPSQISKDEEDDALSEAGVQPIEQQPQQQQVASPFESDQPIDPASLLQTIPPESSDTPRQGQVSEADSNFLRTPLLPLSPGLEKIFDKIEGGGEAPLNPIIKGALRGFTGFLEGITSPESLAIVAGTAGLATGAALTTRLATNPAVIRAASLAVPALEAGLVGLGIKEIPAQLKAFKKAETIEDKTQALVGISLNAVTTATGGIIGARNLKKSVRRGEQIIQKNQANTNAQTAPAPATAEVPPVPKKGKPAVDQPAKQTDFNTGDLNQRFGKVKQPVPEPKQLKKDPLEIDFGPEPETLELKSSAPKTTYGEPPKGNIHTRVRPKEPEKPSSNTIDPTDPHENNISGNPAERRFSDKLEPRIYDNGISTPSFRVTDAMQNVIDATGGSATLRFGGVRDKTMNSQFNPHTGVARIRDAQNPVAGVHELAKSLQMSLFGSTKNFANRVGPKILQELDTLGKQSTAGSGITPPGGFVQEGFNHYMQKRVIEGVGGKVAPKFDKWFDRTFLTSIKGGKKISKALANAEKEGLQWFTQGEFQKAQAELRSGGFQKGFRNIRNKQDLVRLAKAQTKEWKDKFKIKIIDSGFGVKQIVDQVESQLGKKLPILENPYKMLRALNMTHTARANRMFTDGMMDLAGNTIGPSLQQAINPIKKLGKQKEFSIYLWARRAQELHKDGRNPGLDLDTANYFVNTYESNPKLLPVFTKAAEDMYQFQRGVLDYGRQGGLYTQQVYDNIVSNSDNYVPLKRVFDDLDTIYDVPRNGGRGAMGKDPIKVLKGSTRAVKDIFESVLSDTENSIRATHEALIGRSLAKLRHQPNMGEFIREVTKLDDLPENAKKLNQLLIQARNETGGKLRIDPNAPVQQHIDIINEYVGNFSQFSNAKERGGRPVLSIVEGGKLKHFEVAPAVMDAFSSMDVHKLNPVVDFVFGSTARGVRRTATGLNLGFNFWTNPIMDLPTAIAQTKHSPKAFLGSYLQTVGDLMTGVLTGKEAPIVQVSRNAGGQMSKFLGQDTPQARSRVQEILGPNKKLVNIAMHPFRFMDDVAQLIGGAEQIPRIAEARLSAKKAGWKPGTPVTVGQSMQLLLDSKVVTTDFTSAGTLSRRINALVPYWNASIQGNRQFFATFKEDPKKAVASGAALFMVPTLLEWKANKDKEWYKQLTDQEKYGFWHVEIDDNVLRIPKPHSWGVLFSAYPQMLLDGVDDFDGTAEKMVDSALKAFNPGMTYTSPGNFPIALPQAPLVKLGVEQLSNEVLYTGAPVVPRRLQRKLPGEQSDELTTEVATYISRLSGDSEESRISPVRIEAAIRSLTTGAANDLFKAEKLFKTNTSVSEAELADIPVIGRAFVAGGTTAPRASRNLGKFYDKLSFHLNRAKSGEKPETSREKAFRKILVETNNALTPINTLIRKERSKDKMRKHLKFRNKLATRALKRIKAIK